MTECPEDSLGVCTETTPVASGRWQLIRITSRMRNADGRLLETRGWSLYLALGEHGEWLVSMPVVASSSLWSHLLKLTSGRGPLWLSKFETPKASRKRARSSDARANGESG